ncbi:MULTISPECIES: hypothetical protein [Kitasatospora]|uniref:Uncharacterized protein n=2 Tax=Kitasatospora TaxID=2063 RepID=A0ABT1IZB3_9ACTN|nr:hypothetical protein [Kitasatospora paracochleata]MCP2310500.1 hypothetical protein [Kitasatospora paracochleata]
MNHDFDLSALLEESVQGLTVPVAVIVAESNRLGRRRRLQRRLRLGATAAVLAGAAVAGTVLGVPYLRNAATPASPAAAPPSASSSPVQIELPTARLTPEAMLKLLGDELPTSTRFERFERTSREADADHTVGVKVWYDDGYGPQTMVVVMERGSGRAGGCPAVLKWPYTVCTDRMLDDGSEESVETGETPQTVTTVSIRRPSGDFLAISNYNGVMRSVGLDHDRNVPPLDTNVLRAIAEAPGWQLEVTQSLVDAGAKIAQSVPEGNVIVD